MGAPDDRCSVRLESEKGIDERGPACCWRPAWRGHETCIWHAQPSDPSTPKPSTELQESRTDLPERLDGAHLPGATLDGMDFTACSLADARLDGATFREASLAQTCLAGAAASYTVFVGANCSSADFTGADLRGARFLDTDCPNAGFERALLHYARFQNTPLPGADFQTATMPNATLADSTAVRAEFEDANLRNATVEGMECRDAKFIDANLSMTRIRGGTLRNADLTDATLREAEVVETSLRSARFPNASLSYAEFEGIDASGAQFDGADLHGVEFSRVDLQRANFRAPDGVTRLEDGLLDGVDIRSTDLRRTALYQTVFSGVRLNDNTVFDDETVYEAEAVSPVEDGIDAYEAAAHVHRRLETLYDANALSDEASDHHVRKKETERRRARYQVLHEGNVRALPGYVVAWFNGTVVYYGESLKRLLLWWLIVPLAFTVPFVFTGVRVDGITYRYVPWSEITLGELGSTLAHAAYVSVVTFVTIGSSSVTPVGPVGRALYSAEALLGTLLLALFVFVLGRKVER